MVAWLVVTDVDAVTVWSFEESPRTTTSVANKRGSVDATVALLEITDGAMTEIDLAKALVKMFELDDLDMFVLRDDDAYFRIEEVENAI